jgi:hypothetical protein
MRRGLRDSPFELHRVESILALGYIYSFNGVLASLQYEAPCTGWSTIRPMSQPDALLGGCSTPPTVHGYVRMKQKLLESVATTTSAIVAIVAIISDAYRSEALEASTITAINKGPPATIDRLEQIRIDTSLTPKNLTGYGWRHSAMIRSHPWSGSWKPTTKSTLLCCFLWSSPAIPRSTELATLLRTKNS